MRHDVFFYLAQIRILPQLLRLIVDEDRARDDTRLHARKLWKSAELLLYLALELQIALELLAAQADAPRTERMNRSSLVVGICRLPMRFKIVPPLQKETARRLAVSPPHSTRNQFFFAC